MGLEPTTPGATVQCSTIELHPPYLLNARALFARSLPALLARGGRALRARCLSSLSTRSLPSLLARGRRSSGHSPPHGTPGGIRTPDMRLRRPPLYPSELLAHEASFLSRDWSGREDSNLRLPAPKAGALPNCATPRETSNYRTGVTDGQTLFGVFVAFRVGHTGSAGSPRPYQEGARESRRVRFPEVPSNYLPNDMPISPWIMVEVFIL